MIEKIAMTQPLMQRLTRWKNSAIWRDSLHIGNRCLAATFGGYLISAVATILLAQILPLSQVDRVLTAMMLSFTVYTCTVIWVFSVKSTWRYWLDLFALSGLLYLAYLAAKALDINPIQGGGL
jgi:ABC-type antimicrobial peptide transport system permease subunit